MENNIIKQILTITEYICDNYCKWPEHYLSENSDPDVAYEKMLDEKFEGCPLGRLI